MKHPTITEMAHHIIDLYVNDKSICADLTAGNGHDTQYLANKAQAVYAFDIQPQAIEETKKKIQNHTNVTCILDSHVKVKHYVKEPLDFAIFNFGYLPKGDKTITTNAASSLLAVQETLDLLTANGILCLCFYPGHEEGKKEMQLLLDYLYTQNVLLSHYETLQEHAPQLYIVSKRK